MFTRAGGMVLPAQLKTTSNLKTGLEHLKHHIKYPVNRKGLIEACNRMEDVNEADRAFFQATIPEGTYRGPEDVYKALLAKV